MLIPSWGLSSGLQACLASSVLTVGSSPTLTASILLFLLSSLRKHSSATLRLLLPADSVCSAFWKVDPDAEFPRIPGVEMAFILLMHLENKTHLQLSMFQGKKSQIVKTLRTETSLGWYLGKAMCFVTQR